MSFIDLDAFDAAPLQHDPFDFLVVPGFLKPEALAAVNRDFPDLAGPSNYAMDDVTSYGPAFGQLLDELNDPEVARHYSAKFGVDLEGAPLTMSLRKYCEQSDGNIHADHWSKIITTLIYFNEDWPHEGGRLRMLRSKEDIEDYTAEVAPTGGTLLAFRRTDHSYHGHKPFVGERRIMQMSWVRPSRISQYVRDIRGLTRRMRRMVKAV